MTARECSCAKCHEHWVAPLTGIEKAALEPMRQQYLTRSTLDRPPRTVEPEWFIPLPLRGEVDGDGVVRFFPEVGE